MTKIDIGKYKMLRNRDSSGNVPCVWSYIQTFRDLCEQLQLPWRDSNLDGYR